MTTSHAARRQLEWEAVLSREMEHEHIAGMSTAIVSRDGIVWSADLGHADIEHGIPRSADTVQLVASVTKPFTVTAVLRLAEDQRLGLDSDVNTYLPFSVRNPRFPHDPITVRQLITHTSSLAIGQDTDAYEGSYHAGDSGDEVLGWWLREYLATGGAYFAAGNYLEHRPGQRWAYSSVGTGLLGYVVECVADRPYRTYVRDEILRPLGMTRTAFALSELEEAGQARHYAYFENGAKSTTMVPLHPELLERRPSDVGGHIAYEQFSFATYPDGGLRTCVTDLARWLRMWMCGGTLGGVTLLEELSVEMALTPQCDELGWEAWPHAQMGLGWYSLQGDGTWSHGGGDLGTATQVRFDPRRGLAAVVLANGEANAERGPYSLANFLFEAAAEEGLVSTVQGS